MKNTIKYCIPKFCDNPTRKQMSMGFGFWTNYNHFWHKIIDSIAETSIFVRVIIHKIVVEFSTQLMINF